MVWLGWSSVFVGDFAGVLLQMVVGGLSGTRTVGQWRVVVVSADNGGMTESYDGRDRPVVYEARAEFGPRRAGLGVRVLASVGGAAAVLVAAAGIAWGGSALWSVWDATPAGDAPAPLWFPPPPQVTTLPSDRQGSGGPAPVTHPPSTVDGRGGRVSAGPGTATTQREPEPSDDRGGGGGGRGRSPGGG